MKQLSFLFIGCSFLFLVQNAQGQQLADTSKKNIIQGTLGTIAFVNSANLVYDRLIYSSPNGFYKSYYASFGVGGLFAFSFAPGSATSGLITTVGITGLTGSGNHHFETRLGVGYYKENYSDSDGDDFIDANNGDNLSNTFLPNINIGYRKQKPDGGFVFRTGIGIHEFLYVGFGYQF